MKETQGRRAGLPCSFGYSTDEEDMEGEEDGLKLLRWNQVT